MPDGFSNPARCIRCWEGKFVVGFPKLILGVYTTTRPRIVVRKFRAPVVFKVAGDLSSSNLEDMSGERPQGNTILGCALIIENVNFVQIGTVFEERK